VTEISWTL